MAAIEIKYFGMIAEKLGRETETIALDVSERTELKGFFEDRFPELKGMPYQIAVNQELRESIVPDEVIMEISLLPPFAGG